MPRLQAVICASGLASPTVSLILCCLVCVASWWRFLETQRKKKTWISLRQYCDCFAFDLQNRWFLPVFLSAGACTTACKRGIIVSIQKTNITVTFWPHNFGNFRQVLVTTKCENYNWLALFFALWCDFTYTEEILRAHQCFPGEHFRFQGHARSFMGDMYKHGQ